MNELKYCCRVSAPVTYSCWDIWTHVTLSINIYIFETFCDFICPVQKAFCPYSLNDLLSWHNNTIETIHFICQNAITFLYIYIFILKMPFWSIYSEMSANYDAERQSRIELKGQPSTELSKISDLFLFRCSSNLTTALKGIFLPFLVYTYENCSKRPVTMFRRTTVTDLCKWFHTARTEV